MSILHLIAKDGTEKELVAFRNIKEWVKTIGEWEKKYPVDSVVREEREDQVGTVTEGTLEGQILSLRLWKNMWKRRP